MHCSSCNTSRRENEYVWLQYALGRHKVSLLLSPFCIGARSSLLGLPHLLGFAGVLCVPQEQPLKPKQLSMSCFHPPLGCHRYLWHDSESNCVTQPFQSTHKAHLGLYRKDPQFPLCLYRFFHSVVFGC